jgi:hypothetical protein
MDGGAVPPTAPQPQQQPIRSTYRRKADGLKGVRRAKSGNEVTEPHSKDLHRPSPLLTHSEIAAPVASVNSSPANKCAKSSGTFSRFGSISYAPSRAVRQIARVAQRRSVIALLGSFVRMWCP